jgi:hypothetical protein
MGADGLCNLYEACGYGLDDLSPLGDCINLSDCVPARHVAVSPESHALYAEFPEGYYIPLLPMAQLKSEQLWNEYQADQTFEKCCRWLKHRAYAMLQEARL